MKKNVVGYILVAIGLALLVFTIFKFYSQKNKLISPVPGDRGVKVIYK